MLETQPWKILYQNIRCLVSENSRSKIDYFRELTSTNGILIINLTETWLDETISDDAKIEGYKEYRSDRIGIKQGGTVIYVHNDLECDILAKECRNKCEMVAVNIKALNTINIVIYRPPKTKGVDFNYILDKVESIFNNMEIPNPTIIMTGDFNFPFIEWRCNALGNFMGCTYQYNANVNTTVDEKQQFERLTNLVGQHSLVQAISEATREENGKSSTLDLVFTNEIDLITEIGIYASSMSDHHNIELTTSFNPSIVRKQNKDTKDEIKGLRSLNFYSKEINWKEINKRINEVNWYTIQENKSVLELLEYLMNVIKEICENLIPKKSEGKRNALKRIPRARKKLLGRMKMLKKDLKKAISNDKKVEINKRIQDVEKQLIDERKKECIENEKRVIEQMKTNPKVLFSYVKRENKRREQIGPFKDGDRYIYNNEEICVRLLNQFISQFSNARNDRYREDMESFVNDIEEINELNDIIITKLDIINAIGEMKENSSAGPDDIPSIFLIKTKESISGPLEYLMRKSLDEGIIPQVFKMAYITPIHKGGAKTKPEQYRPVSLTSHLIKIFERVLKKPILLHLINNNLINENQHGFVRGRSTQSQLLSHYQDIYEALEEGLQTDTIFLDFAKAFDKVDHEILLKKIDKHGIKGKIGNWIKEFLSNRKFIVVANGTKSEEGEVKSGVPQGTVLAAILFIIMISDIDDKVKESIVRCFADDTRVSKKIEKEEDKQKLQEDLNAIYEWAEDNLLLFNDKKFEQITYGENPNMENNPYKNPANEVIKKGNSVKDLGIICNSKLSFKEHIQSVVVASRRMSGMILRTFHSREPEIMMKLFSTYLRSKMEYCCSIWSPSMQNEINELERIQKSFTSKINGMEELDYHQRLKALKLYSLERRRERYLIIYAWQMTENIKENVLNLKIHKNGRSRTIYSRPIRWIYKGTKIKHSYRSQIHESTSKKMERLFNCLPPYIRNIEQKTTDTFKFHLDKWLQNVPDLPRIDNYGARVAAENNSIIKQAATLRRW